MELEGDCVHVLYSFFFKQKTAYEMRISDWSSDVCSSDLVRRLQTTCESSSNKPRDDSAVAASGNRRHPVALAVLTCQALVLQGLGDEDGELQRLLGVEPGVAVGVVAVAQRLVADRLGAARSEEHTSELQSLMRISYSVFCLTKK